MKNMIGIDIGTTGCRAAIYREDGKLQAADSVEYPLLAPFPMWAEQNPEEIYQGVLTVVANAVRQANLPANELAGICFSSVFHSMLPVDEQGEALYPLLTWADMRSQVYTDKIKREYDAQEFYRKTGCPVHPMSPFAKILWFRYERPDIYKQTPKYISIKSYILYRFFNKFMEDKSLASGTGIYNLHTLQWDPELMNVAGIDENQLGTVVSTTHIEAGMNPRIAARLGINADTPVVVGAGDGVLSALGAGVVNPGQLISMIGTSGAVRVVADKPRVDEKGRTMCYNLTDDCWFIIGAINNGGIAQRWVRDKLASGEQLIAEKLGLDPYEILSQYAAKKPAGSDGLIMVPFFAGERAPYWNANARGVLFGLNLSHGKRHIVRATLEGIIYRMFSVYKALDEVAGPIHEIRVGGSFVRSKLWVQIMADVFGRDIAVPEEPAGSSAFGAAVLGMHALGIMKKISDISGFIHIAEDYRPDLERHQRYQRLHGIYERIYWNLQKEFEEIAEIQRTWK